MLKAITLCAALIGSAFVFQSCKSNDNVAGPQSANFQNQNTSTTSGLEAIEEVVEDSDAGARSGLAVAPISKENKVYQVFKVTGTYSTTSTTTSAALAVTTSGGGAATLPDSTVKGKNGWSLFSVKPEKYNTYLKKTVDKTLSQSYYIKDRDAKVWHKLTDVTAGGSVFTFLPNYFTNGLTFSNSGGSSSVLN